MIISTLNAEPIGTIIFDGKHRPFHALACPLKAHLNPLKAHLKQCRLWPLAFLAFPRFGNLSESDHLHLQTLSASTECGSNDFLITLMLEITDDYSWLHISQLSYYCVWQGVRIGSCSDSKFLGFGGFGRVSGAHLKSISHEHPFRK